MVKQKIHPVASSRDEKMEEWLQHMPEPLFFAKEEKVPASSLAFETQDVLKFQFDLSGNEQYCIKYKGRNLKSEDSLVFYDPELKGMLAFFYALDRGYGTVHLDEADTTEPALCYSMEAVSEKTTDSCLLTFSGFLNTRKCKISKGNPSIISSSRCRKIFPMTRSSGVTYRNDSMQTAARPFWTKT